MRSTKYAESQGLERAITGSITTQLGLGLRALRIRRPSTSTIEDRTEHLRAGVGLPRRVLEDDPDMLEVRSTWSCRSKASRSRRTSQRSAGSTTSSGLRPCRSADGVDRTSTPTCSAEIDRSRSAMDTTTIIIGLEVHVQLQTESKMFSWCGTEFGLPPNTQTDPVSLGLPGTLPVMNRKAFELALKTAVALARRDRAVHQVGPQELLLSRPAQELSDQPVRPAVQHGRLARRSPPGRTAAGGGRCRLTRVHLEEDTGKLTHAAGGLLRGRPEPRGHPAAGDRHRARHPQPGQTPRRAWRSCGSRSATWASPTARCRRARSAATPTSTCTSHKDGKTIATPIVEIKNLNSFRAVEQALLYEAERQYAKWQEDGLTIKDAPKTTRGWSDAEEVTKPQREKETAADYRYFPEPDLVPVVVDEAWVERDPRVDRRAARARRRAVRGRVRPLALRRQRPGRAGAGRRRLLRRRRQGHRRVQAREQLDPAGRAADDQGARRSRVAEFPVRPDGLADLINRVKRGRAEHEPGARGPRPR